jgi:thioredoxin 1
MVKKINSDVFANELQGKTAVVDFSAEWCGPCKMLAPVMEELSEEMGNALSFLNTDIDANGDLAVQYGIMSIPAVVVFRDGAEIGRQIGFVPKEQMKAWLSTFC